MMSVSPSLTDRLIAAVHAAPDRDEPRHVLADHLLELGDPRGELMSLQLARAASGGEPTPREKALLKRRWQEWCAPLGPLLGSRSAVFDRGFLAAARISNQRFAYAPLGAMSGHPTWSTVRTVMLPSRWAGARALRAARDLLCQPVMRRIEALLDVPPPLLSELDPAAHPELRELGLRPVTWDGPEPASNFLEEILGVWAHPRWPELAVVSVDCGQNDDLLYDLDHWLPPLLARVPAQVRTIGLVHPVRSAWDRTDRVHWAVRFSRDDLGGFTTVDLVPRGPAPYALATALERLPLPRVVRLDRSLRRPRDYPFVRVVDGWRFGGAEVRAPAA